VDRLKAEFTEGDAIVWLGAEGAEGIERSRRSPKPEDAAGGAGFDTVVAGDEKEEKSPKPLLLGGARFCACAGGDFAFEVELKKSPPPPNMFDEIDGDFVLE
jgi:hypothetical protein